MNNFLGQYGDYLIGAGIGFGIGVTVCGTWYAIDRRKRTSLPSKVTKAVEASVKDFKSKTEKKERNATAELMKCASLLKKFNFKEKCEEEVNHFCTAAYAIERISVHNLVVTEEEQAKLVKALEDSAAILVKNEFKK